MQPSTPIELDALLCAEGMYRHSLLSEPADTSVRLRLAWCLFVQAVHQAGRESILGCLGLEPQSSTGMTVNSKNELGRSVDHLLRDCLRQTTTVRQLTGCDRERADVEMLQSLVRLAGAEQWTTDANAEATRRLKDMTRALMMETGALPSRSSLKRIRPT